MKNDKVVIFITNKEGSGMKNDKVVTLPVCELIEDLSLYPRHQVDGHNVSRLIDKMDAGITLDPIVVDAKSKRITDGWHRARGYKRRYGDGHMIEVILRDYESEADMLADAVRMNDHGLPLQISDWRRVTLMLSRYGWSDNKIAVKLYITEPQVIKLKPKITTSPVVTRMCVPGTRKIVLKAPLRHLEGTKITEEQALANDGAPGTSYRLLAGQLISAIRAGVIDPENELLKKDLTTLKVVLEEFGY